MTRVKASRGWAPVRSLPLTKKAGVPPTPTRFPSSTRWLNSQYSGLTPLTRLAGSRQFVIDHAREGFERLGAGNLPPINEKSRRAADAIAFLDIFFDRDLTGKRLLTPFPSSGQTDRGEAGRRVGEIVNTQA